MKRTFALTVGVAALALSGAAYAVPPFCEDNPDHNACKGGGGEEGYGNNLSVPTIFAGSEGATLNLRVPDTNVLTDPSGPESDRFPGYWEQKTEATWQTEWMAAGVNQVVPAYVNWSDNLTKHQWPARQPIRVEMVLYDPAMEMTGFEMTNLTPELPDREAVFGTDGDYIVTPLSGGEGTIYARIFSQGATLRLVEINPATGAEIKVVYDGPMSAEINSGGAVVYGYNWGIGGRKFNPTPGWYRMTFTVTDGVTDLIAIDPLDLPTVATLSEAEEGEGVLYVPTLGPEGCAESAADDLPCTYTTLEIEVSQVTTGGGGNPNKP